MTSTCELISQKTVDKSLIALSLGFHVCKNGDLTFNSSYPRGHFKEERG